MTKLFNVLTLAGDKSAALHGARNDVFGACLQNLKHGGKNGLGGCNVFKETDESLATKHATKDGAIKSTKGGDVLAAFRNAWHESRKASASHEGKHPDADNLAGIIADQFIAAINAAWQARADMRIKAKEEKSTTAPTSTQDTVGDTAPTIDADTANKIEHENFVYRALLDACKNATSIKEIRTILADYNPAAQSL